MNDTTTNTSPLSLKPVSADEVRNVMQYVREHNIKGSVVGRYVDRQFKIFSFDELREDLEQNRGEYITTTQGQFLAHCLLLKALPPDIGRRETSAKNHDIRTLYRTVDQLPRNARTLAPEAKKQLITMLGNQEAELIKELGEMMNAPYQSTSQIKLLIASMRKETSDKIAGWQAQASDQPQSQNRQIEELYATIREGLTQLSQTLRWGPTYFGSKMREYGFLGTAQQFLDREHWKSGNARQFFDALTQLLTKEQADLAAISFPNDMKRTKGMVHVLPITPQNPESMTIGELLSTVEEVRALVGGAPKKIAANTDSHQAQVVHSRKLTLQR